MQRFGKINWMLHLVYPETLSRLIVTNVPGVFGGIWNVFKPLLPERTVKKIQIWASKRDVTEGLSKLVGETNILTMQASGLFLFSDAAAAASSRNRLIHQVTTGVLGASLVLVIGSNVLGALLASAPSPKRLEARPRRRQ
mmetsp:Transcript_2892/g.6936  ORF Transcript_2892/g.6936 Transcript_2892/m.6936 type:complete len:140 (+) Transcript_2892:2-421(+)